MREVVCGQTLARAGTQACTVFWVSGANVCARPVWLCFSSRLAATGAAWAISIHTVVTKWFSSTRLETRTKESSTCASSQVASLLAQ